MGDLRKPFFIAALVLIAIVVLLEIGATAVLKSAPSQPEAISSLLPPPGDPSGSEMREALQSTELPTGMQRPGLAISYLALVDGLLLFTVALMGVSLIIGERLHARVQGCATLVVSLLVLVGAILLIIAALVAVIFMLSLLLATPFGTLAYLAIFGFFNRAGAKAALGLLMGLKVAFAVVLILAQQRFLQNRGLLLLIITALVANVIISFLHGLVPSFLVSITDGVAAIVVGILAAIWAIVFLIGSIPAVIRALRPDRI
jgi:uncharacterized membrane protein YhaH (DUF805 family)